MQTTIRPFFDPATWTFSYVISDNATRMAAVVDPVLDFDLVFLVGPLTPVCTWRPRLFMRFR